MASDLLPKGSAEVTREFLNTLVTLLLNYVEMENDRSTRVLEFRHPKQLEQIVDIDVPDEEEPCNLYQLILDCQQALQYQVRSGAFFDKLLFHLVYQALRVTDRMTSLFREINKRVDNTNSLKKDT